MSARYKVSLLFGDDYVARKRTHKIVCTKTWNTVDLGSKAKCERLAKRLNEALPKLAVVNEWALIRPARGFDYKLIQGGAA